MARLPKFSGLLKLGAMILLALLIAIYLMQQQKTKEHLVYSTANEIQHASQTSIYQIKLEFKGYEKIPDFIFDVPKLRSLKLGFNRIRSLDPRITRLTQLKILDINGGMQSAQSWITKAENGKLSAQDSVQMYNRIDQLPKDIGKLRALRQLDVRNNELKEIPTSVGDLLQLEGLHLQGNLIEVLPKEIGALDQLKTLNLYWNKLCSLPDRIVNLSSLETLSLNNNALVALPSEFGNLKNLATVHLQYNQLEYLPASIGDCAALKKVILEHNKLRQLPPEITKLQQLEFLNVKENRIDSIPTFYWEIPNLKTLILSENKLQHLESTKFANTQLVFLDLSQNNLKHLPDTLSLNELKALHLSNNLFDKVPSCVYTMRKLESLFLDNNHIANIDIELLKQLPQLKKVVLSGNPLPLDLKKKLKMVKHIDLILD